MILRLVAGRRGPWLSLALSLLSAGAAAQSVTSYHGAADRSGRYIVPALSWARAGGVHLDGAFHSSLEGQVYAQPLYWLPPGAQTGRLIVATEADRVYALDAATGAVAWQRALGTPVPSGVLPCGNIAPIGITGTPVIDPAAGAVYVDALELKGGVHHLVYGLSLADGHVLAGWPIDVAAALHAAGRGFNAEVQGQRSALSIVGGELYVDYAGNYGDCGNYHGWVVGFGLKPAKLAGAWATRAHGGGSWAQGGIAYDGQSMFVATGNTMGASAWGDGEAVIRLRPDLAHSNSAADTFAPADWQSLDGNDLDLGGTGPLPVDVPRTGGGTLARVLALGKDGNAYLLDRARLGGIGGELARAAISYGEIITGPATYQLGTAALVALEAPGGAQCPAGQSGNLVVLRLKDDATAPIHTAWCASVNGNGSPVVTVTKGTSDPIVWMVGAEGDNQLHAFRGSDGAVLFGGGNTTMSGLHHMQTILPAAGRLYVAADGTVYAFAY